MNSSDTTTQDVIDMLTDALSIESHLIHKNFTSMDHPNWDSLANMTLAAMLHDRYSITITPDEVYTLNTVDKLSNFIENNLSGNADNSSTESVKETNNQSNTDQENKFDIDLLPLLPIEEATRALLNLKIDNNTSDKKININIASTFTTQPIESSIKLWCKGLSIPADVSFCDFNQIETELITSNSQFYNENSINIILVRPEDLISQQDPKGYNRAQSILNAIDQYCKQVKNTLIVGNMPPIVSSFYIEKIIAAEKLAKFWQLELEQRNRVEILDFSRIITEIGCVNARHSEMEIISRSPYSQKVFQQLGVNISRLIRKLNTPSKKVIVLDADNTLWGGVIGEDGIDNIKIGDDHPGRSFRLFQEQILSFKDKGILLALASKNEEQDVLNVLNSHPGMLIKNDDFASKRINWLPKSESLRSIAEELNLGLDSLVFLDDSPAECLEVKTNTPEVTVIQMPKNKFNYGEVLNKLWLFDTAKTTNEDKLRNKFTTNNIQREKLRDQSTDLNTYLKSLDIRVQMKMADENNLARVAQLSQKTNQFNLSLIRRSLQDLNQLNDDYSIWTINVQDQFGDYGLVGACILNKEKDSLIIDSLFLSCRALGREVEDSFIYGIQKIANSHKSKVIIASYINGPRNQQVEDFLYKINFTKENDVFVLNKSKYIDIPAHINWKDDFFVLSKGKQA